MMHGHHYTLNDINIAFVVIGCTPAAICYQLYNINADFPPHVQCVTRSEVQRNTGVTN